MSSLHKELAIWDVFPHKKSKISTTDVQVSHSSFPITIYSRIPIFTNGKNVKTCHFIVNHFLV